MKPLLVSTSPHTDGGRGQTGRQTQEQLLNRSVVMPTGLLFSQFGNSEEGKMKSQGWYMEEMLHGRELYKILAD